MRKQQQKFSYPVEKGSSSRRYAPLRGSADVYAMDDDSKDDMPQCPRCWYQLLTIIAMIKAVIARLIFAIHSFIAVWRLADVKNNPVYCQAYATQFQFSPVVFFYLCSVVPAIWFLELDLLFKRLEKIKLAKEGIVFNFTENTAEALSMIRGFGGVYIPIMMTADEWAKILEQLLLLFLIIGRWLLPKGDITRDQLSQLLLVNIGMAADIIELFEAFREDQVKYNYTLTVAILSLWTGSLCQFTLVVTATKARKPRVAIAQKKDLTVTCFCCETEIWAIMTSIMLQDGPFLVLRMLLIFRYEVVSYMNVFFTCKNTLVMLLQLYRIAVVILERQVARKKDDETETISMSMSRSQSGISRISRFSNNRPDRITKSRSFGGLVQNKSQNNIDHSSYPCLNSKSAGDLTVMHDNYYPRPTLKPKYPKHKRLLSNSSHLRTTGGSNSSVNTTKQTNDTDMKNDDSDRLPLARHETFEQSLEDSIV
ncbi:transmembrane protein 26-like [Tubulanus polymorphus]|uniref:transmembrane protein 26-like n=1 Tax=Tubulanus polymorphus TaxID=672921 RepID=UPI003DA480E2